MSECKYKQCCYCGADALKPHECVRGGWYRCGTRDGEEGEPALRSASCILNGWNPLEVLTMRDIVLDDLRWYMTALGGRLPRGWDYIRNPKQLEGVPDAQLVMVLIAAVKEYVLG